MAIVGVFRLAYSVVVGAVPVADPRRISHCLLAKNENSAPKKYRLNQLRVSGYGRLAHILVKHHAYSPYK